MSRKYEIGTILQSNKYGKFKIIDIISHNRFKIKFILTGFEKEISRACMTYGEVRDPYYPIYYGVGCLGDIKAKDYKKELYLWRGMIYRCYDKNNKNYWLYGGNGITVCKDWLCFEKFLKDIPLIKGYDKDKFFNNELELDKDMSYIGNGFKEYSLKTCVFLPYKINFSEMLARRKLHTSSRYVGVTKLKDDKWQVTYCAPHKNIYVGRFSTEKEAHEAYEKFKKEYILQRRVNG